MVVAPVVVEIVPGPVRLQVMGAVELVRVAVKGIAAPPTATVAVAGATLRVTTVTVAEAVSVPKVAVMVAVPPVPVAGGV